MNKFYIPKRESNINLKVLLCAWGIFCFVVFHFCAASKNVFAAVSRFVVFAVSLGTGALDRKLQNRQNGRQRQKHFLLQQKNEKQQNTKSFERSDGI